jgi:hypothetical protein
VRASQDLEYYLKDIRDSGGRIVSSKVNINSEIGFVTIEVANRKDFLTKFAKTDSLEFSNFP